ncbi:CASTOR/POLLUX-related putative ion channel [uncultured Streptomyces sp.]|uniref:CASTOR/POLLUX-related putative ion channel n=1 Tax=uncultured Streptomyces sp. TaxID=174707 RepID=UPI00262D5075|nr:NAD-binding protein [uncultured Streptomyces sp.]
MARGTSTLICWLALACLVVVVPLSAVLVWTDDRAPLSLGAKIGAVWRSTGQTLRLGGEVGPPQRVLLSVLLALIALLYVSTVISVITTGFTEKLIDLRRGHSAVVESGHTIVLGWSEQTPTVVQELLAALAHRAAGTVVVVADRDKTEMEEELRAVVGHAFRTRLICRSGRVTDPAVLARVGPDTARAVIVLPPDDPALDAETVKVLLALRAVAGGAEPVPVVAAVRDDRYLAAARLAAGPRSTVLETDDLTARLLAQCVQQPGLSHAHQDLLDFAGAEFHTVDEPSLTGRPFRDALTAYRTSCVVGVVRADGAVLLNPNRATRIRDGDRLLVVAEDDASTVLAAGPPSVDAAVMTSLPAAPPRARRLLLLGWNRRAPRVLAQLALHAAPGSVLDVVTGQRRGSAVAAAAAAAGGTLPVVLRAGDPALHETIDALDVDAYDSVMVLGPDRRPGLDGPDDRTLVTLLLLRAVEQRTGRGLFVATEMMDDRNRVIAPVGPGTDFIVSGRLLGLLMAQISQNGHLAVVFEELFSATGNSVRLRAARHFVRAGCEASFATVVASAGRQGACAIGYRTAAAAGPGDERRMFINPDQAEVRRWAEGDEVIVIEQPAPPHDG